MTNIIILSFFVVTFFYLVLQNVKLKNRYIETLSDLLKTRIDNNVKDEFIKKTYSKKPIEKTIEQESQEHFIKFLSDSRDAAFLYIEDVQSALSTYIDIAESFILESDDAIMINEFSKLRNFLPDDYGKIE